MSVHVSITFQPGGREDLKNRLLESMDVGFSKTSACSSAHSRGFSHGFIRDAWDDLHRDGLVAQPQRQWEITELGREHVAKLRESEDSDD